MITQKKTVIYVHPTKCYSAVTGAFRNHQMNSIVTDVKQPQQRTAEQTRAIARQRIIFNAKKRAKRTSPKVHPPKLPVSNSPSISSPVVPAFSEQTLKRFDMAVKGLKVQGRSLSQRLLICHHHLQSDPALSGIRPELLLKELSAQNK